MRPKRKTQPQRRRPAEKKPETPAEHEEAMLDEALRETFPASDPVARIEPAPRSRPSTPRPRLTSP